MIFLGAIIVVAAIAGAIALVIIGKGKYNKKVTEKEKLEAKIQDLQNSGIVELESRYNAAVASSAKIIDFHNDTYRTNEEWNAVLKEIETKTVTNMVVSELSSDPNAVTFQISVSTKEEAAKLIMQFQSIPYFESVSLTGIREKVSESTGIPMILFTLTCAYKTQYVNLDFNGDGKIDEKDDKNGDGVVDKLDLYGDSNLDGKEDIRDIIKSESEAKAIIRNLIEFDINNDGTVDEADDIDKDGEITDIDRDLFARLEYLSIETIGDLNSDGVVDILDGVEYLRIQDELEAAEKEAMKQ